MTDNVVNFNKDPAIDINELLENAKSSDLASVVLVGTKKNGDVTYASANLNSVVEVLGAIEITKHHFLNNWTEKHE